MNSILIVKLSISAMTGSTSENFESSLNAKKKLFIIVIKFIYQKLIEIDK